MPKINRTIPNKKYLLEKKIVYSCANILSYTVKMKNILNIHFEIKHLFHYCRTDHLSWQQTGQSLRIPFPVYIIEKCKFMDDFSSPSFPILPAVEVSCMIFLLFYKYQQLYVFSGVWHTLKEETSPNFTYL